MLKVNAACKRVLRLCGAENSIKVSISKARKDAELEIVRFLIRNADTADILDEASKIYWSHRALSSPVYSAWRRVFGKNFIAHPISIDVECRDCGRLVAVRAKKYIEIDRILNNRICNRTLVLCLDCGARRRSGDSASKCMAKELAEQRQKEIVALRLLPYSEYLKTDHWQHTRKRALIIAGYACHLCNSKDRLQVHHKTYERRGYESQEDLTVLCERCHKKFHDILPEEGGGE